MASRSIRLSKIYNLSTDIELNSVKLLTMQPPKKIKRKNRENKNMKEKNKLLRALAWQMHTESRSQSRKMLMTLMKFLEVSPFVHNEDRDRLKKVAFRDKMVVARASRLANPCIRIAPVSTFWAMATANPLLSHLTLSNKVST